MTRDEHIAQLKAEGRYEEVMERLRQAQAEHQRRAEELDRAEASLVAELHAAGYPVKSAWLLRPPYPRAVPILLDHFKRPYPDIIREGIARRLGVKEAMHAWGTLKSWYVEEQEWQSKDGLASALCALTKVSGKEHLDEVIELVRDRRNGPSRLLLLSALEKSKEPRAWATLMDLGTDPDLILEIQHILKKRQRKKQGRRPPRTNE